jgi:glutamate--cysteine ligase
MDLDPFEPVGISAQTMRFLDVFLLHCLLSPSPPDTPDEIAASGHNQHNVAERGREPGLMLERGEKKILLSDWADEILDAMGPVAARMDAEHHCHDYVQALEHAVQALHQPYTLPSAQVLSAVAEQHGGSFVAFARAQSQTMKHAMMAAPVPSGALERFDALAAQSWVDQRAVEAADTMPFDVYLKEYLDPRHLQV